MAAHADQIGLIVTHVDADGYLFVARIGGVAPLLVPGRHFVVHGRGGDVHAVGGRKPTHIIPAEDRDKAPPLHEQFLDIGARDRTAALERVAVGDPVTFMPDFVELSPGVVATQALDDRAGVYAMVRALELYAEEPGAATLAGFATVHEETTFMGAKALALRLRPDVMIVLDGDFCSDTPAADAKELAGEVKLGAGPVLSRGAGSNERLIRLALEVAAAAEGIPVQVKAYPGQTDTDADELMAAEGAATITVGLPMRYMHSPYEVAHRRPRGHARLVAALARRAGDRTTPDHARGRAPVKLFIAIDLEGISGVVSEADTAREGAAAQRARAHMRADLDAVLAGCAAAGADEVVVCDAHDDGRNLDPAGLPGWVTLVSGSPTPGSMLEGLAPDCDAALFVGYHARAGTPAAVLEHTWTYRRVLGHGRRPRARRVRHRRAGRRRDRRAGRLPLRRRQGGGGGRGARPGHRHHRGQERRPQRGGALRPAGSGARAHDARRGGGAPGRDVAGAARLERRFAPPDLHTRAVLRPRRDLPRRAPPGRTHTRDRRRHVR